MITFAVKEKLADSDYLECKLPAIPSKGDILDIDKSYFVIKNIVWSTYYFGYDISITLLVEPLKK